jgi:hypothetical protein
MNMGTVNRTAYTLNFNGTRYAVVCDVVNTRNGFAHVCELLVNTVNRDPDYFNLIVKTVRVNYINRTWESYQYRTAIYKLFSGFDATKKHVQDVMKIVDERKRGF